MVWKRIFKKLYGLNVLQSLLILVILSLPLVLYLSELPIDYRLAKTLARLAIIYFLAAFLLYLFLLGIRYLPKNSSRKRMVLFTRVYIRFHIALALIGTVFIVIHAILMLTIIPLYSLHALTGLLSVLGLFAVLGTGYLRKRKSSGTRRRFHRYMAILFILFVMIHLI